MVRGAERIMRGEKEARCFERVKNALFFREGKPIYDSPNSSSCFNIGDNIFKKEYLRYCNPDFNQNYFGLLEDDRIEFSNIIRTVKANPSSSKFPDFIFGDGFIEHFQITSSQTTRKGATHTRKESDFWCKADNSIKEREGEWNEAPSYDKVCSESWVFQNPIHGHTLLMESFKKNWEQHIKSSEKYGEEKKIGIFMIEYPEKALAMFEDIYCNCNEGMAFGDMRKPEKFDEYRLSRDKELLKYIYDFRCLIKYVIFLNLGRCEVIRTENIPFLLEIMPWEYKIQPMKVYTISTTYNISAKTQLEIEGKNGREG